MSWRHLEVDVAQAYRASLGHARLLLTKNVRKHVKSESIIAGCEVNNSLQSIQTNRKCILVQ